MQKAYEKLRFYQNICEIRKIIHEITKKIEKNNFRLVGHMRDSARGAKQNIREGYSRDSAGDFARFIKISRASLDELEGDLDDCDTDQLIDNSEYKNIKELLCHTKHQIDRYLDALHKMDREGGHGDMPERDTPQHDFYIFFRFFTLKCIIEILGNSVDMRETADFYHNFNRTI